MSHERGGRGTGIARKDAAVTSGLAGHRDVTLQGPGAKEGDPASGSQTPNPFLGHPSRTWGR